jgi:hypothetical protein
MKEMPNHATEPDKRPKAGKSA